MPSVLKILGQSKPAATTLVALYTVPAATTAVCSSIVICNQNANLTTFRVSVAVNGAGDTPAQYLYYDVTIAGYDTFIATIGISLGAGDVVRVYNEDAYCSFNLFGQEIS
jgi:hypothetical protein